VARETTLEKEDHSKSVATTSGLLVPPNARRRWVSFSNNGSNDVWLQCDTAAAANTGILLGKSGGIILLDMETTPWYGAINAIAITAAVSVAALEVRDRE
jgi:hypothetical protein